MAERHSQQASLTKPQTQIQAKRIAVAIPRSLRETRTGRSTANPDGLPAVTTAFHISPCALERRRRRAAAAMEVPSAEWRAAHRQAEDTAFQGREVRCGGDRGIRGDGHCADSVSASSNGGRRGGRGSRPRSLRRALRRCSRWPGARGSAGNPLRFGAACGWSHDITTRGKHSSSSRNGSNHVGCWKGM